MTHKINWPLDFYPKASVISITESMLALEDEFFAKKKKIWLIIGALYKFCLVLLSAWRII